MAKMLQLERKLLSQPVELALRGEVLQRGTDETLGDLERRLDLDAGGGAGVEHGDRHRHDGGEQVDQSYRDKELGADRPIVPKLLQHEFSLPAGWGYSRPTRHIS